MALESIESEAVALHNAGITKSQDKRRSKDADVIWKRGMRVRNKTTGEKGTYMSSNGPTAFVEPDSHKGGGVYWKWEDVEPTRQAKDAKDMFTKKEHPHQHEFVPGKKNPSRCLECGSGKREHAEDALKPIPIGKDFEESKHPRASNGEFGHGSGRGRPTKGVTKEQVQNYAKTLHENGFSDLESRVQASLVAEGKTTADPKAKKILGHDSYNSPDYKEAKDARQIGLPKGGGSYIGNQIARWKAEILPTASEEDLRKVIANDPNGSKAEMARAELQKRGKAKDAEVTYKFAERPKTPKKERSIVEPIPEDPKAGKREPPAWMKDAEAPKYTCPRCGTTTSRKTCPKCGHEGYRQPKEAKDSLRPVEDGTTFNELTHSGAKQFNFGNFAAAKTMYEKAEQVASNEREKNQARALILKCENAGKAKDSLRPVPVGDTFEESKHPREDDGKFGSGGSGSAKQKSKPGPEKGSFANAPKQKEKLVGRVGMWEIHEKADGKFVGSTYGGYPNVKGSSPDEVKSKIKKAEAKDSLRPV